MIVRYSYNHSWVTSYKLLPATAKLGSIIQCNAHVLFCLQLCGIQYTADHCRHYHSHRLLYGSFWYLLWTYSARYDDTISKYVYVMLHRSLSCKPSLLSICPHAVRLLALQLLAKRSQCQLCSVMRTYLLASLPLLVGDTLPTFNPT